MQVNTMGFDVVASYIALPRTVQTRDAGGPKKGVGKRPRRTGEEIVMNSRGLSEAAMTILPGGLPVEW